MTPENLKSPLETPFESAVSPSRGSQELRHHRIAIVGAGCSGLKLAQLLIQWQSAVPSKRQVTLTFFDSSPRIGGLIQTLRLPSGLKIEAAAQGVLASRQIFLKTLEDIGLAPDAVIAASKDKKLSTRFVISPRGQMAALKGPFTLLTNGLLNIRSFIRALMEFFVFRRVPPDPNETLYQFVERRFGRTVAENFMIPLATGIWGGGAEKLLARHAFPLLPQLEENFGSVIRGILMTKVFRRKQSVPPAQESLKHRWPTGLLSFPDGLQTFTDSLEAYVRAWGDNNKGCLEFRLSDAVESLRQSEDKTQLVINSQDAFDAVFWTPAPWKSPRLMWDQQDAQRDWMLWQSTDAHSLIVVNVSGPKSEGTRDGFGVLARRESTGLLGVLFVHSIYPAHVPSHNYSYRVLLGGDRLRSGPHTDMMQWNDEKLTGYTLAELRALDLIDKHVMPDHIQIIRWDKVVGLADTDHDDRQHALWRLQARYPQIFFAGLYKKGVGVADALQSAQESFDDWKQRLNAPRPNH